MLYIYSIFYLVHLASSEKKITQENRYLDCPVGPCKNVTCHAMKKEYYNFCSLNVKMENLSQYMRLLFLPLNGETDLASIIKITMRRRKQIKGVRILSLRTKNSETWNYSSVIIC